MTTPGQQQDQAALSSTVPGNRATTNASVAELVQHSIAGDEGTVGHGGSLLVMTGIQHREISEGQVHCRQPRDPGQDRVGREQ